MCPTSSLISMMPKVFDLPYLFFNFAVTHLFRSFSLRVILEKRKYGGRFLLKPVTPLFLEFPLVVELSVSVKVSILGVHRFLKWSKMQVEKN